MVMLNSTLPDDIRILSWAAVGRDFSARFNCLHRTYKYFFPKGNMDIHVRDIDDFTDKLLLLGIFLSLLHTSLKNWV